MSDPMPELWTRVGRSVKTHAEQLEEARAVKELLDKGADVNQPGFHLFTITTPLEKAVAWAGDNVAVIKVLLDHGACVSDTDPNKQQPLHFAVFAVTTPPATPTGWRHV